MAPCETPCVAVAWPLPTILINRFERRYNALRFLGCQTTVEILVFPMRQNFWQYCKVNALEGLEIDSLCPYCWKSWVRMFVLPFSPVHLSPVSFLRRNAKVVFLMIFCNNGYPISIARTLCTWASSRTVASSRTASIDHACKFDPHLPPALPSIA